MLLYLINIIVTVTLVSKLEKDNKKTVIIGKNSSLLKKKMSLSALMEKLLFLKGIES